MYQGIIQQIHADGAYGWIKPDDGTGDVFWHRRDFERAGLAPPRVGDRIIFDVADSPKGRKVAQPLSRE